MGTEKPVLTRYTLVCLGGCVAVEFDTVENAAKVMGRHPRPCVLFSPGDYSPCLEADPSAVVPVGDIQDVPVTVIGDNWSGPEAAAPTGWVVVNTADAWATIKVSSWGTSGGVMPIALPFPLRPAAA